MASDARQPQVQTPTSGPAASVSRWLITPLLELIFPPRCAGCGRVDYRFCPRCHDDLTTYPLYLHQAAAFDRLPVAATSVHEGIIQSAIHAMKYHNLPQLAQPLSVRLADALRQLGWQPDLIAPVPMHTDRLQRRGYNQAERLSAGLAAQTEGVHHPNLLLRVRSTRSQVGLNRAERLANLKDAFAVAEDVTGQHILLVDDVFTTGATLMGCAESLIAAGAAQIYGLTVSTARLS